MTAMYLSLYDIHPSTDEKLILQLDLEMVERIMMLQKLQLSFMLIMMKVAYADAGFYSSW
jgi:hypothetical protein